MDIWSCLLLSPTIGPVLSTLRDLNLWSFPVHLTWEAFLKDATVIAHADYVLFHWTMALTQCIWDLHLPFPAPVSHSCTTTCGGMGGIFFWYSKEKISGPQNVANACRAVLV